MSDMTDRNADLQGLSRAAYAVDSRHHFHAREDGVPVCSCGFEGDSRKRTQTEHITTAVIAEYLRDQQLPRETGASE